MAISRGMFSSLPFQNFLSAARISATASAFSLPSLLGTWATTTVRRRRHSHLLDQSVRRHGQEIAFLARLQVELLADLTDEQRRRLHVDARQAGSEGDRLRMQAALARELPSYWQRFDEIRTTYTAECIASGGERRGALRRLFGRR